jgi:hypothetical protein
MPAIRVVMSNGTTKSFREGTSKYVIRQAQLDMLAEMKASGEYEGIDFGEIEKPLRRKVIVTQSSSEQEPDISKLSWSNETSKLGPLAAAGMVSTGQNDPSGGVSYGAFQFSSEKGTPERFLQGQGSQWRGQFEGLDPKTPGAFGSVWRAIAATEPDEFYRAQRDFIRQSYYDPVVKSALDKTGVNIDSLSPAVRSAVWSTAVQHGQNTGLINNAINSLSGHVEPNDPSYERNLIDKIYDLRADQTTRANELRKSRGLQELPVKGMLDRFSRERAQAIGMLP